MGQTPEIELSASSADAVQNLPHEVVSLRKTYADGHRSQWHLHKRHQLLYAISGLMMTDTADVSWAVPTGHGLILPAQTRHSTKMAGEVRLETLYFKALPRHAAIFETCRVVSISTLLASLISCLCEEEATDRNSDKAFHLRALILLELAEAPTAPLALPFPKTPRLSQVCTALITAPAKGHSIDHWAAYTGKSRRAFTRDFQAETGLSFGQWTRRLSYQLALEKAAQGVPPARIAAELGYSSPYALTKMINKLTKII